MDSVVEFALLALIFVNVAALMASTVPTSSKCFGSACKRWGDTYEGVFETLEAVSVVVFSIEYVARLWACMEEPAIAAEGPLKGRVTYATRFFLLVDLASILPWWVAAMPGVPESPDFTTALRVFRLFRLLKAEKYISAFGLLAEVLRENSTLLIATVRLGAASGIDDGAAWRVGAALCIGRQYLYTVGSRRPLLRVVGLPTNPLAGLYPASFLHSLLCCLLALVPLLPPHNAPPPTPQSFYAFMFWVTFATLLYLTEVDNPALGNFFQSIPASLFPTLLMLTGEYPLAEFTAKGQVVAGFIAIVAVAVFAVPTAVIGSGFVKAVQRASGQEFSVDM